MRFLKKIYYKIHNKPLDNNKIWNFFVYRPVIYDNEELRELEKEARNLNYPYDANPSLELYNHYHTDSSVEQIVELIGKPINQWERENE